MQLLVSLRILSAIQVARSQDPSTKDAEVEVEQDPLTGGSQCVILQSWKCLLGQQFALAGCYKVACASTARAWIGLRGRPGVVTGGADSAVYYSYPFEPGLFYA